MNKVFRNVQVTDSHEALCRRRFPLASHLPVRDRSRMNGGARMSSAVNRFSIKREILVTAVFSLICAFGFGVQVYYISDRYFQYITGTSTTIRLPTRLNASSASLCIRYADLIPLPDGQPSYVLSNANASAWSRNLTRSLTIREIFDATPSGDSLITKCLYRQPHTYRIFESKTDVCLQFFPVTKYFMMESICYAFFSSNSTVFEPFLYQNLAFSLRYPGLFFSVTLNRSTLKGANFMRAIVHGPELPVDSIAFAPSFYRVVDSVEKYNKIHVGYSMLRVRLLPPPYSTQCDMYHLHNGSQKMCVNDCIDKKVQSKFGKVPFNVPRVAPIDLLPISWKDIDNVTFTRILDKLESQCDEKCSRKTCIDKFYTTTLQKEEKDEFSGLSLHVSAPKLAEITITNMETLTLTDFFVYVTSCFGTWFGLSVLSFQPSALVTLFRSKQIQAHKCCCTFCSRLTNFLRREVSLLRSRFPPNK